jgi:hypothetical protein
MTKDDLKNFASADLPIRCSSFPAMVSCPTRFALTYLEGLESPSGPAADTGSAAHLGVKLWHDGKPLHEIREAVRRSTDLFPKADLDEAEKFVLNYSKDERNAPETVIASEMRLEFSLPPHPYDKTKLPIYCAGTCDQVRKDSSGYSVWDYKTGNPGGLEMLNWFMPQLAAYTYGCKDLFPEPPRIGGIIRARGYTLRGKNKAELQPNGVFFESGVSDLDDCLLLLNGVRLAVALIRRGEAVFGPGESCVHCPLGGVGSCLPAARRYGLEVIS